jgi:hypothetical protein
VPLDRSAGGGGGLVAASPRQLAQQHRQRVMSAGG